MIEAECIKDGYPELVKGRTYKCRIGYEDVRVYGARRDKEPCDEERWLTTMPRCYFRIYFKKV